MTSLDDLDFADDLALLSHRIQDIRQSLGRTRCQGRPEDQCDKDKIDAYWYQSIIVEKLVCFQMVLKDIPEIYYKCRKADEP